MSQREVPADQIRDTIEASAVRNSPIAVTCRIDGAWKNYRSRFLGLRGDELWIEYATPEIGMAVPELMPGVKLGLAFKQRHHKFVFTSEILAVADFRLSSDLAVRGLRLSWPQRMQRLQRRSFYRATVPSEHPVYCELWHGGLMREPKGSLRTNAVYSGQVVDISAGGLRVRLVGSRDPSLQVGDSVGLVLNSTHLRSPLRTDAQFRHADTDEFGLCLGLQFSGLGQSAESRHVMDSVNELVAEFQRIELRRLRMRSR